MLRKRMHFANCNGNGSADSDNAAVITTSAADCRASFNRLNILLFNFAAIFLFFLAVRKITVVFAILECSENNTLAANSNHITFSLNEITIILAKTMAFCLGSEKMNT